VGESAHAAFSQHFSLVYVGKRVETTSEKGKGEDPGTRKANDPRLLKIAF